MSTFRLTLEIASYEILKDAVLLLLCLIISFP
jgi:hypothetical protein